MSVHSGQVAAAVKDHLQDDEDGTAGWLTRQIAAMERELGLDPRELPLPGGWRTASEIDRWLTDTPPAVIIAVPGTLDVATTATATYEATWDVRVGITVSVGGEDGDPEELAGIYGAAIREAITQHSTLGGFAKRTTWLGEDIDNVPATQQNPTLGMSINRFAIRVVNVARRGAGVIEPPDDPYETPPDPIPNAEEATITVQYLEEDTP